MKCFACGTEPTGEPWVCECGGTRIRPRPVRKDGSISDTARLDYITNHPEDGVLALRLGGDKTVRDWIDGMIIRKSNGKDECSDEGKDS